VWYRVDSFIPTSECHVSAVSRGRSPGDCFPQLGPWWSAQRNDYRSPLVRLANTTDSVRGSTKRGITVQARAATPSIWGHFLNDDSRCDSKPARWQCRVPLTKERIRHDITEEPANRDRTRVPLLCLNGPTEKHECINPRKKSARPRNAQKNTGSNSNTFELPLPVRGDIMKRLSTNPVWVRTSTCSALNYRDARLPTVARR
jgi:hypothetical protein